MLLGNNQLQGDNINSASCWVVSHQPVVGSFPVTACPACCIFIHKEYYWTLGVCFFDCKLICEITSVEGLFCNQNSVRLLRTFIFKSTHSQLLVLIIDRHKDKDKICSVVPSLLLEKIHDWKNEIGSINQCIIFITYLWRLKYYG